MIVTCESCKSRYKIEDSKISGRGARITCPRCKHQFVVYTAEKNAAPAVMDAPKGADWDDEPTRVGARKDEAASSPVPETPPPRQEEAPGPSYEVAAPRQVQKLSAADAAARAPTLDFRKVGINAWKVKVKIGLIYDFGDLKTLRKYIQDGRVTSADLISYDGKTWKSIGEIPDLDIFFVETYDQLFADMASRPPEEPKAEIRPEPRVDSPSLPDGMSLDELQESKKTRPRPNGSGKSGKASTPGPSGAKGDSNRTMMMVLAVVVLVALAGGIWWASQGTPETPTPPAPTTPASSPEDREKLRKDIESKMTPAELPPPAPTETPTEPKLTPVVPKNPPPPSGGPNGTPPTTPAGSPAPSKPSDLLEAGDAAARSGNWSQAIAAYSAAAKLEPRNASTKAKLGLAQYNANDANAQTTLEEAAKMGAKGEVLKALGNLYQANGDTAGARDYYQKYLAGKPADAAAIEKKLKDMNGG